MRIVVITVPYVSRSCEHFLDGFDFHLLVQATTGRRESLFGQSEAFDDFASKAWLYPSNVALVIKFSSTDVQHVVQALL